MPPRAIVRALLHYTEPGDLVFDGFAGSGITGVAAQMCGALTPSSGRRSDAAEWVGRSIADTPIFRRCRSACGLSALEILANDYRRCPEDPACYLMND